METEQKRCRSSSSTMRQKLQRQEMKFWLHLVFTMNMLIRSTAENARIVYKSEKPLGAKITGAETMNDWEHYKDNVWVCRVDNGVFGNYNPYTTMVGGDWYFAPVVRHTGAVYLNDRQRRSRSVSRARFMRRPGSRSGRFTNGIPSRTKRKIRRSSTQISRVKTRRRKK